MTKSIHEDISALVDGEIEEADAHRIVDELIADPALVAEWSRYHLISDALREKAPAVPVGDLALRVSQAIAAEPAILADVVPLRPATPAASRWKPLAGLALAASVATVAILGARNWDAGPAGPQVAQAPAPATAQTVAVQSGKMRWDVKGRSVENRLNSYLVNHSEYLNNGMQGMLPYARIVSYDAGR
jgi:sigma-E factor negative regulatory protein RseA